MSCFNYLFSTSTKYSHSQKWNDYGRITDIISSCITPAHYESSFNLIGLFLKKHKDKDLRDMLYCYWLNTYKLRNVCTC